MKIYYYKKQKVEIGEIIDINGFNTQITMDVIEANPNSFKVEIQDESGKIHIKKGTFWKPIKDIFMYGLDEEPIYTEGYVYRSEKDNHITDNEGDKNHSWSSTEGEFVKVTELEFDVQDLVRETKRRYEKDDKVNQNSAYGGKGTILTIENNYVSVSFGRCGESYYNISIGGCGVYHSDHKKWARKYLFTTEDGIDIYEGDSSTLC